VDVEGEGARVRVEEEEEAQRRGGGGMRETWGRKV